MRRVIRLGDPTSHGGRVLSASGTYVFFGKPVARMGDKVSCPIPGHGVVTIVEGDPDWTDNGKPVVLEGHHCSCGCVLISTLPNVLRSQETLIDCDMKASSVATAMENRFSSEEEDVLEYYFVAERDDGSVIHMAYLIESAGRKLHEGVLSADGRTVAFPMSEVGNAIFWIGQS